MCRPSKRKASTAGWDGWIAAVAKSNHSSPIWTPCPQRCSSDNELPPGAPSSNGSAPGFQVHCEHFTLIVCHSVKGNSWRRDEKLPASEVVSLGFEVDLQMPA